MCVLLEPYSANLRQRKAERCTLLGCAGLQDTAAAQSLQMPNHGRGFLSPQHLTTHKHTQVWCGLHLS